MKVLIGHTGFVGSILKKEIEFDLLINRDNISEIHGLECEIICCGLPAEKWRANLDPNKDYTNTIQLINSISKSIVKKITTISTIDVYENPINVRETDIPHVNSQAYGRNRFMFEQFVSTEYDSHQIIRLPGLFGEGLKKNIIFDLMHDNNVDKINKNSSLQWYPMNRFCKDLKIIQENTDIKLINLCTEPLQTEEIINECFSNVNVPESETKGVAYDVRTNYGKLLGGNDNYAMLKQDILLELKDFIK